LKHYSDDLDLMIVGGYYGKGTGYRSGSLSHFMLGLFVCLFCLFMFLLFVCFVVCLFVCLFVCLSFSYYLLVFFCRFFKGVKSNELTRDGDPVYYSFSKVFVYFYLIIYLFMLFVCFYLFNLFIY
jgi:hypothetical protein